MPSREVTVANMLADRLAEREWHVVRDPVIGGARAAFGLQRKDGVALVADLTLEEGVIHFASLGQVASYRGQLSPRGEGLRAFVLLTTGEETPEVAEIARALEIRVITAGGARHPEDVASRLADELDVFSHFEGFGADKPPWALAPLFNKASEDEIERLSKAVSKEHYAAGTVIYDRGSKPAELYVVTKGIVHLTLPGADGEIPRMQLSVFGEMAAVDGKRRIVSARASTNVEVWKVPTPAFLGLLATNAHVRQALYDVFAQIIRVQAGDPDGGLGVLRDTALVMRHGPPPRRVADA